MALAFRGGVVGCAGRLGGLLAASAASSSSSSSAAASAASLRISRARRGCAAVAGGCSVGPVEPAAAAAAPRARTGGVASSSSSSVVGQQSGRSVGSRAALRNSAPDRRKAAATISTTVSGGGNIVLPNLAGAALGSSVILPSMPVSAAAGGGSVVLPSLPAGAGSSVILPSSGSEDERRHYGLRSSAFCLSSTAVSDADSVTVPETLLNHLLETEAMYLALDEIRAVSMQEILDCLNAYRVAKFIHAELPKRLAVRIRMIDNLIDWKKVPELARVRNDMHKWFRMLRLVKRGRDVGLRPFLECIKTVKREGKDVVADMSAGMHKLHQLQSNDYTDEFVNQFLDDFFMIRIGSNMLVDQCISLAKLEDGGRGKPTGIVDTECDATSVCEQAAEYAKVLCSAHTGKMPKYSIETYIEGMDGPRKGHEHQTFSHVPAYLRYIMVEILKNSFKATVTNFPSEEEIRRRPITILVSSDEHHCAIRVSDRAGGIPYHLESRIWSYLYGRAAHEDADGAPATALAGYGVGLPLSRLHARYLGGTLHLGTFPGYGTDVTLHLPIIHSQQSEDLSVRCLDLNRPASTYLASS